MLLIWLTRSHPESMSLTRETILRLVSESKKHEQSAAQITELHQVNSIKCNKTLLELKLRAEANLVKL